MDSKHKRKLCFVASAGGHLTELSQFIPMVKNKERFFVSDKRYNAQHLARKEKMYYIEVPRRNPFALLKNIWQSWKIFHKEQPDVVISTGADVALAMCLIAKMFGKKLVFIETFTRAFNPSLTGKIVYPFADLFFIQWKELQSFYPNALYYGSVV